MNQQLTKRAIVGLGGGALALAAVPKAEAAPFTTFAYAATGAPTNRTTPARLADIINVKDYGAKGDGTANDGPSIQAALDAAYGPASNPNGASYWLNKGVYFPAGKYLVGQQLFVNQAKGAYLFGAGKYATVLKYTGPNSLLPGGNVTALLTCRSMDYSRIQGITFDVTGSNADTCVQMMNFGVLQADGTGDSWFDCGFVGASASGWVCTINGSGATGSEQFFLNCLFDGCQRGLWVHSGNGLDYTIIGCSFKNCIKPIFCDLGGINLIAGCSFDNPSYATFTGTVVGAALTVSGVTGTIQIGQNVFGSGLLLGNRVVSGGGTNWTLSRSDNGSVGPVAMTASGLDIYVRQNQCPAIIGGRSTSPNFCEAGPVAITGLYHNPTNLGGVLNWQIDNQDQAQGIVDGCLGGLNSQFYGSTGHLLYLRGSTFNNAGYLTPFGGTVKENI